MKLHERIVKTMKELGISPAELCRLTGIGKSEMHYVLTGKTKSPRAETVVAIADALGVDYNFIFGWDEKCAGNLEQ